ncbi:Ig-like domain-containing protein, partial [Pseudomonas lactis]|uniref:Ig-like domain-containing protein n=1 Tax=Pseudomonas lactis TaxID=1615674 RepID=UPI00248F73D5
IAEGGSTDDTTPTLSGGGQQPGDTVTIIDNGTIIGTAPVKDDGSWEFTPNPPLNDGDHDFTIIVTDPAGNASEESDPYKVIIDTQAPAKPEITSVYDDQGDKTGVIAKGSITDDAQPDIKGTAEPGSTVIIYDGGKEIGRAPVDANGDWSFTPTLPLINGPHELTAKSEDLAGNISGPCDPFDFNLITGGVPPAPAITGALDDVGSKQGNISPGGVTDDKRPTISGTGEPGTTVKVYADGVLVGTGTVKADGQWSVDLTQDLKESLNNITATTTNGAGNVSPETGIYPIIVDTTAPAASAETLSDDVGPIVGTINDNDTTDDNTPTASGTAEPGTTVIIYDKGVEIGRAPVKDDGTWSFTPNTPLADGDHSFSTVVEDAAGNQ